MTDIILPTAVTAADFSDSPDFSVLNQQYFPFSIRLHKKSDDDWVDNLHQRAFGPGRFARTAFRVREMLPVDSGLCLIAQFEDKRVGSVWMTSIVLGSHKGCLLGPLAIDPEFRNRGLGKMLVKAVTAMALNLSHYDFVVLVGDESYYGSFGFEISPPGAIIFPGPVDKKRILVCTKSGGHAKIISGVIGQNQKF